MANKQDKITDNAVELVHENIFLTTIQILRIFNVTRTTFDRWRKNTDFPKALYITNRPIWKTQDVIEWAETYGNRNPESRKKGVCEGKGKGTDEACLQA